MAERPILYLTLKRKWFDMIASGEKKEEYRQDKLYWKRRFVKEGYWHSQSCKEFDKIIFRNGYKLNAPAMEVECLGIKIADFDEVNEKWFGSLKDYEGCRIFIIKLGKVTPLNTLGRG